MLYSFENDCVKTATYYFIVNNLVYSANIFHCLSIQYRSYFAFNLASEHHKFYMKLRDSFISLQHISNELNIPLGSIILSANDLKKIDIIPSDYETDKPEVKSINGTVANTPEPECVQENVHENVKIIDKQTKTAGMRVRNLKKSMLNDNKLIKLRNKFLKRSKSSAGISAKNMDLPNGKVTAATATPTVCNSKEECQNKENELPKHLIDDGDMDGQMSQQPKVMSPNRNRVKMGTRVFSSQFLNKSFDNIYDNAIDVYRIDDADVDGNQSFSYIKNKRNQLERCDGNANGQSSSERETIDDELSLKSTSLSSLYFSEKMSEKFSESPLPSEAYVIRK